MTTKRRGTTEEAADAAIDQACRMLRMPTIRNSFTDYADRAGREPPGTRGSGVHIGTTCSIRTPLDALSFLDIIDKR
ncbi:hypothetical protein [Nonomuraea fuscirosea]|uniref:hypothetical protein n=1 Tax=Nonomuraea fuscirosea TaxID=1291556 RepID=UPI0033FF06BC